MFQIPAGRLLIAGIIGAFLSITGYVMSPMIIEQSADIWIEPDDGTYQIGDIFYVSIVVESRIPVNVFSGLVTFNPEILYVDSIDYNTSIADLWAVLPWYDNGDGTLNFAGGTTRPGGFTGNGTLITIGFKTKQEGMGALTLTKARILKHDGLGTDVELSDAPIDAIFSVAPEIIEAETIVKKETSGGLVRVIPESLSFDLNGDGLNTFADVSIFMIHLTEQNLRSDFNQDGKVNIVDANLILSRR